MGATPTRAAAKAAARSAAPAAAPHPAGPAARSSPLPVPAACPCGGGCPRCQEDRQPKIVLANPGHALNVRARTRMEEASAKARTDQSLHFPGDRTHARERAQRAIATLEQFVPDRPLIDRWRSAARPDRSMSVSVAGQLEGARSDARVSIHSDRFADQVAMAHDAEAVTVGTSIYTREGAKTPGLLAHEMVHAIQSTLEGPIAPTVAREREAADSQRSFLGGNGLRVSMPGPAAEPMAHPAEKVLLRTGQWLLTRTTRAISKHIARHGRRIAGRAAHSIFRNPRAIRELIGRAVREATELARSATRHGADEVLEEGGVRVFRQGTRSPGKFRWIVEKDFGSEIGTRGERILRVVLDMSGRVVTAFPVERFLGVGLGAAALGVFEERTAEASEKVRSRVEAEANRPTDWPGEIIDFLNPISGGNLNEGEQLDLDIDRIVQDTTEAVIREIEETERMSLNVEQRQAIRDLVAVGIGSPLELEEQETD